MFLTKGDPVEVIEQRLLLSASPLIEARDFPFTLSGSYTGKNPGTYVSVPSNSTVPYLDSFSGELNGAGTVQYEDNMTGAGSVVLSSSPGSGADNFWKHYEYNVIGSLQLSDSGGILSGGPGFGSTRVLDEESIQLYSPPTKGTNIQTLNPGGIPADMSGNWSAMNYDVSINGQGPFVFTGNVTPTILDATDIKVTDVHAGYDCVQIEVNVTGAFPRALHATKVGFVKAEWLDQEGKAVETLFDQPVYWNTGKVSLDAAAARPISAVQLRVSTSIQGDSDQSNNEQIVDYVPNLMVTDFGFNLSDGVTGHYRIEGANLKNPTTVGLYWSSDGKFGEDDLFAYEFNTLTTANQTGQTHEFPVIHGDAIAPPTETQSILIAVIDPSNAIRECEESDNERSDELVVRLNADVFAAEKEVRRGESYTVNYVVRNDSPVQLNVEVTKTWTSDTLMLNQPEVLKETVLVKPGESVKWTGTHAYSHNWEWVPKAVPIYQPNKLQELSVAILEDSVSKWPPGKLITTVYDALNFLVVTRPAILGIVNHPRADVVQHMVVRPLVVSGSEISKTYALEVYVGEDKERALDAFKETALDTAAVMLGLNFGIDKGGSSVSTVAGYIVDWFSTLNGNWQAVYDPPDASYTVFSKVQVPLPDLSEIPAGPRRSAFLQHANRMAMQDAILSAIDKKDGASVFGDQKWKAQQLVDLAVVLNRQVFNWGQSSNYAAYLAPWTAGQLASPAALVNYWQTHGLPTNLTNGLTGLVPDGYTDEMLAMMRGFTADDFSALSADVEPASLRYQALANAGQAIAYLKLAIETRLKNGLSSRALSPAEESLLSDYRSIINARQATSRYGGDFLEIASAFASELQRLALLTNNYVAIDADLNLAYMAVVNAAGANSIGGLKTSVSDLNSVGDISGSLKSLLNVQADLVESTIKAGDWSGVAEQLTALRSLLDSAAVADISAAARERLLNSVDAMINVNSETPGFSSPVLAGIPDQTVMNPSNAPVLGSGVTVSEADLASFVGGRLTLTLSNQTNDLHWMFNDGLAKPLAADDEISLAGMPVGRVVSAGSNKLEIDLLADATTENVQEVLRKLQIDLPTSIDAWTSRADVKLSNGVGGAVETSLNLILPAGLPVANDDVFIATVGTTLTGNVITNTNPNGGDSDPVVGAILTIGTTPTTAPSKGSLTLTANGDFTYTANVGATGIDTFVYTLNDGQGGTDTATVTITLQQAVASFDLDIDGNGVSNAFQDAALLSVWMLGTDITDADFQKLIPPNAAQDRNTVAEIRTYLDSNRAVLDIDGNGVANAFQDAALLSAWMLGADIADGDFQKLIPPNAAQDRNTVAEIRTYLNQLQGISVAAETMRSRASTVITPPPFENVVATPQPVVRSGISISAVFDPTSPTFYESPFLEREPEDEIVVLNPSRDESDAWAEPVAGLDFLFTPVNGNVSLPDSLLELGL